LVNYFVECEFTGDCVFMVMVN